MTDTRMTVLRLGGLGYSCAQIVLKSGLNYMGRENPDLIRAAAGLAQGGGCSGELCGALSGGLCLLGLYLGKGLDSELPDQDERLLYNNLIEWFRETQTRDGRITCDAILGLEPGQACAMNPAVCGEIVASVMDYTVGLLVERGYDPSLGREV